MSAPGPSATQTAASQTASFLYGNVRAYVSQTYSNEKNATRSVIQENPFAALVTFVALTILAFFVGFLFPVVGNTIFIGSLCIIALPLLARREELMHQLAQKTSNIPGINLIMPILANLFKSDEAMPALVKPKPTTTPQPAPAQPVAAH